jgi:hypothetical protein
MKVEKRYLVIASCALGVGILFGLASTITARRGLPPKPENSWKTDAITATYVGVQLKQMDNGHAALVVSYDLQNSTNSDFRLADTPAMVIMTRLKSDGSLSQEESLRLSYPVFLPARQRVRVAIEGSHPFEWPAQRDPKLEEKLREFVTQRLRNIQDIVLFDQADRFQVELPAGWRQLNGSAGGES